MIKDLSRPPRPMDLDLDGVEWPLVVRSVLVEGDTNPLIDYLRNRGSLGPEEREFIAKLLEGTIKAGPKRRLPHHRFSRSALRLHISEFAHLALGDRIYVEGNWDDAYDAVARDLAEFGIPTPKSRREATDAAKRVLCGRFNITLSQLDEYLSVRTARQKFA